MAAHIHTDEVSEDLFKDPPATRCPNPTSPKTTPAELRSARVLSRALGRQKTRREKKRIAHLICLNLITMLKHRPDN